MTEEDNKQQV